MPIFCIVVMNVLFELNDKSLHKYDKIWFVDGIASLWLCGDFEYYIIKYI